MMVRRMTTTSSKRHYYGRQEYYRTRRRMTQADRREVRRLRAGHALRVDAEAWKEKLACGAQVAKCALRDGYEVVT